jgi:Domain of unknown function (DUF4349)
MKKTGFFIVVLSTILTACDGGSRSAGTSNANSTTVSYASEERVTAGQALTESKSVSNSSTTTNASYNKSQSPVKRQHLTVGQQVSLIKAEQVTDSEYNTDRKIVRNAELDLEAESPEIAQQRITSIAEMKGGFVVESQQSMSDIKAANRDIGTMTVRVPADKFSEALDEIRKTSSRVVSETVKGEDVTEEYIDVEAQLKAKKALEAQFMEIMKRASRVDEALEVQSELADVRTEIEKIEGRKRFLENKSSLSTIKITLRTAQVIASASQGFGGRFVEAFDAGMNVATSFILGLVTLIIAVLPFGLIVGLPTVLVFRYFWRKQTRPKSVSEIAREEINT